MVIRVTTKDGAKHNLNTKKREAHEEKIPKVFDYKSDQDYGELFQTQTSWRTSSSSLLPHLHHHPSSSSSSPQPSAPQRCHASAEVNFAAAVQAGVRAGPASSSASTLGALHRPLSFSLSPGAVQGAPCRSHQSSRSAGLTGACQGVCCGDRSPSQERRCLRGWGKAGGGQAGGGEALISLSGSCLGTCCTAAAPLC